MSRIYRPKNSFVIKYYFKITLLSLLLENSNGSKMEVISDKPTRKFYQQFYIVEEQDKAQ